MLLFCRWRPQDLPEHVVKYSKVFTSVAAHRGQGDETEVANYFAVLLGDDEPGLAFPYASEDSLIRTLIHSRLKFSFDQCNLKGWLRLLLQLSPVSPTHPCLSLQSHNVPCSDTDTLLREASVTGLRLLRGSGSANSCQRDGGGPGGWFMPPGHYGVKSDLWKNKFILCSKPPSTEYTLLLSCVTFSAPQMGYQII